MNAQQNERGKNFTGMNKGTLTNIRFDKHVDSLFDGLTVQEKPYNNDVITNQKHTKKIQEIRKETSCSFYDKMKNINLVVSVP